ncbi:hypothetical protein PHLH4_46620 [Pseudomonas sp. St316]|nr:hypothetical protein PHLH4_46620 [Pseudomonas sp. St316]
MNVAAAPYALSIDAPRQKIFRAWSEPQGMSD